jgi:hypothetical protein
LTIDQAFTFVLAGNSTNGATTNTPNLHWHLYTGANSADPAFNQQWSIYDRVFDSTICGGLQAVPASPMGQFPLVNYVYSCNTKMDRYQEMVENNVTTTGAVQALQVAMEIFGNHTIGNPTVSRAQSFAFLKGWQGISDATGTGIATGNFWSLLNGWNSGAAIGGPTIRWGMKQGTSTLNPFEFTTPYESNVLQEIYDTLLRAGPYIPTNGAQIIGYMADDYRLVQHSLVVPGVAVDISCPASIGAFPVQGCIKMVLRGDIFFHDGVQVTASDVKFSFENFNSTGGIFSPATTNVVDVVYNPAALPTSLGGMEPVGATEVLYVAVKSLNFFTFFDMTRVPIVPQHVWKTVGASGPCADTSVFKPGTGKGTLQCIVDPAFLSGPGADPVANNMLIGSGPFVCGVRNNVADPTSGFSVLGGGCTNTGTSTVTSGSITLYRYGTGVSHLSGSYFRSNAKYREFAWALTGSGPTLTILDISAIQACFSGQPPPSCAHYRSPDATVTCTIAGPCIGTVSGGNGGPLTGLQKAEVIQWYQTAWTTPIAYGTLDGVLPAPPQLQEDGSLYS